MALKLLKRFKDLSKESLSDFKFTVPILLRESLSLPSASDIVPDKFSSLAALAKMPSAFPSGTRFGFLQQIVYDRKFLNLSLSW